MRMISPRFLVCLLLICFLGVSGSSVGAQQVRKKISGFDGATLVHVPPG